MRSSFAIASLLVGIFSFLQFLGGEKAILAILFGILALREIKEKGFTGKYLAIGGIVLGIIYIAILVIFWPFIMKLVFNLASQG